MQQVFQNSMLHEQQQDFSLRTQRVLTMFTIVYNRKRERLRCRVAPRYGRKTRKDSSSRFLCMEVDSVACYATLGETMTNARREIR